MFIPKGGKGLGYLLLSQLPPHGAANKQAAEPRGSCGLSAPPPVQWPMPCDLLLPKGMGDICWPYSFIFKAWLSSEPWESTSPLCLKQDTKRKWGIALSSDGHHQRCTSNPG